MNELDDDKGSKIKRKWHCLNQSLIKDHRCTPTCASQKILTLFGKNYILVILRALLLQNGPIRFNELEKIVGASPKTLTVRLRELENAGLISRTQYNEIPIRVEYYLTEAGQDLEYLFEFLAIWLQKWNCMNAKEE
jgi:DNA-binding HxlR family transcriptional regulator